MKFIDSTNISILFSILIDNQIFEFSLSFVWIWGIKFSDNIISPNNYNIVPQQFVLQNTAFNSWQILRVNQKYVFMKQNYSKLLQYMKSEIFLMCFTAKSIS